MSLREDDMKQMTCPLCGCVNAADFVFKVLCPEEGCRNYDSKLAEEQDELQFLDEIEELDSEIDFLAGKGFVLDLKNLD